MIDYDTILATVTPADAIERVRAGFERYARGEWAMPPKVYLDAPPDGDFRAMPARGDGLAIVKWVTSFPVNRERGLPVVAGLIIASDAATGQPLALIDGRAVTALRTGAVAAVASRAIAPAGATTVGIVGCGLHGGWAARCMAAAGYGPGLCHDSDPAASERLASELGWSVGDLAGALACDVVCTITPGSTPVIDLDKLRPGLHVNALGADGPGKAELTVEAVAGCRLYCDEWAQAAHGGELTGAARAELVARADVTELGALLIGTAPPPAHDRATLFDSTGLAIQDLAIASELMNLLRAGTLTFSTIRL